MQSILNLAQEFVENSLRERGDALNIEGVAIKKGDSRWLPAIMVYDLMEKQTRTALAQTGWFGVELVGYFFGVSEFYRGIKLTKTALQLGKVAETAIEKTIAKQLTGQALKTSALGAIDLGMTLPGTYISFFADQNWINQHQAFVNAYRAVSFAYFTGRILISIAQVNKLKEKADDLAKNGVTAEEKAMGKSIYTFLDEPIEVIENGKLYGRYLYGQYLEIISTSSSIFPQNKILLFDGTTTVTGILEDVNTIARRGQMYAGITKMGENKGGINILRSPRWQEIKDKHISIFNNGDEIGYWRKVTDDFWEEVNKPWLEEAIKRGDRFRFVSNPELERNIYVTKGINFILDQNGNKIKSIFGREIELLKSHGYKINSDGIAYK